jgi:phosphonate transport system ATP-binding protein
MTTASDNVALLKVSGAQVIYPNGTVALRCADLSIRAGEFLVLLGPSGAGKSTLLRCLNGLVRLSAGSLKTGDLGPVESREVLRAHRKRTGMVFQQHQLIGRLSALDNVLTGRLGYHGALRTLFPLPRVDRLIALESLARVGLLQYALTRADQLSVGQQQRVGVARALAQRPRIMLADEPIASLDPAAAVQVLSLIHDVCKADGIAAVVSLHQVELARRFADRVIGIHAGSVAFEGAPAALDSSALERIYGGAHADATGSGYHSGPQSEVAGEPAAALAA